MNNFEAKYMKISSKYLSDKIKELNIKSTPIEKLQNAHESAIKKIVSGIFK